MTEVTRGYVYDHAWVDEPRRLDLLERLRDPSSRRRIAEATINPGERCLEVGAGRGSMARWMAQQVGPRGSVLAIDLDCSLVDPSEHATIEVRDADVLEVDLPSDHFDVIHARLVLTHIGARRRAMERMAGWLAPGGRLVLEEVDFFGFAGGDPEWTALVRALIEGTSSRMDWFCGRELLAELGLVGLEQRLADVDVDVIQGASPLADWYVMTMRAMRDALVGTGAGTDDQLLAQLRRLGDPAFSALGLAVVGASGRKPPR